MRCTGLRVSRSLRIVFAGTPSAAVPALDALLASSHEVVAVVTRPDARSGRGRQVTRSAVGMRADEAGLEVLTPLRPADPDFLARLSKLAPQCCPVVAYGGLIPPAALAIPPLGWVNLHFSILPAWRGAAPVQHALLHGDEVTGATTFRLEPGLDTGPVFGVVTETIHPTDTADALLHRLARSGAQLLVATLDGIAEGGLVAQPQPADGVSHAPKISSTQAQVDWAAPALRIDRLIRAFTPAPGAWSRLCGDRVGLGPVQLLIEREVLKPGQLLIDRNGVRVGTGSYPVQLTMVQPAGKRPMAAVDWARGLRLTNDAGFDVDADSEPSA